MHTLYHKDILFQVSTTSKKAVEKGLSCQAAFIYFYLIWWDKGIVLS